jgi:hypothetical protein
MKYRKTNEYQICCFYCVIHNNVIFVRKVIYKCDKKAVKTNLDFIVHTCIVEFMQIILHLIYTYLMIFKVEHNLLHLINKI